MSTNGILTIQVEGQVVMKVITGLNGFNGRNLAEAISTQWPLTRDQVYDLAIKHDFGVPESLVVMDETNVRFDGGDELPELYRSTFNDPEFNPRWANGMAEFVVVLEL